MMKAVNVFKFNPVSARRNIMSEEIKKTSQTELSEQELDKVAGGGKTYDQKTNDKGDRVSAPSPKAMPPTKAGA